jgi:hypothetical protein
MAKLPAYAVLAFGALTLSLAVPLRADTPESICARFKKELDAFPHTKNEVVFRTFEHQNISYAGCGVEFRAKRSVLERGDAPQKDYNTLFYPFAGSVMHKEGWRASYETGGPGATGYVITKGNILCLINWYFEAGIDETTNKLVTSDDLYGHVSCATK